MGRTFLPVVHAAVPDRPDEQDTVETAKSVAAALCRLGYAAQVVDIGETFAPLRRLAARRPEVVFNLVEAVGGNCARAPLAARLMQQLGLQHTGAGAEACELTASKIRTKRLVAGQRVPTPRWWSDGAAVPTDTPVIVKSDTEHASLGIDAGSVVPGARAAAEIARRERRHGGRFFAEEFVDGREFNVALIQADGAPLVLPIPEILFDDLPPDAPRIVDYGAKWDRGSHAYHHTPRRFGVERAEPALAAELACLAVACWHAAGLAGYARVDFRVDERGHPTVLEINANPCLAPDAGFVAAAEAAGLGYDALIARIVDAARLRRPVPA